DWATLKARDVMRPVDDSMFINSTAPVAQAKSLLAKNGIGRAAVLDASGVVVGYISQSDFG
ncbi:MAG: CBS domain-containing protein, partial [Blastocatellia bacterium]